MSDLEKLVVQTDLLLWNTGAGQYRDMIKTGALGITRCRL